MVLHLKVWESRSLPGLPSSKLVFLESLRAFRSSSHSVSAAAQRIHQKRNSDRQQQPPVYLGAGWSSLVARQAHNLKVRGSNPLPATKYYNGLANTNAKPFLFVYTIRTK